MLLHLEGAIRPDVAPVGADAATNDIQDAESIAEAVATLRARIADAQASLAMADAAARINRAEVARLASVIRLREELAEDSAALEAAGGQASAVRTPTIRRFMNAGEAALGGLSAASIVFGAVTTFAA